MEVSRATESGREAALIMLLLFASRDGWKEEWLAPQCCYERNWINGGLPRTEYMQVGGQYVVVDLNKILGSMEFALNTHGLCSRLSERKNFQILEYLLSTEGIV